MMRYQELPTTIGGSTSDEIFSGRRSVQLRLALKDSSEVLTLNLQNIFYHHNSPCNLSSLGLFHDSGMFHDIKTETVYQVKTRKSLAPV